MWFLLQFCTLILHKGHMAWKKLQNSENISATEGNAYLKTAMTVLSVCSGNGHFIFEYSLYLLCIGHIACLYWNGSAHLNVGFMLESCLYTPELNWNASSTKVFE